jgi:hypothetical protein
MIYVTLNVAAMVLWSSSALMADLGIFLFLFTFLTGFEGCFQAI